MDIEGVFPYASFREGQLDLTRAVYGACKRGNRLVIEAMNDFGKTAPC